MKRFLLWICAAALTASSALAGGDAPLQRASGLHSPYAGLPGLAQPAKKLTRLERLINQREQLPAGAITSPRMKTPAKHVSFLTPEQARVAAAAADNTYDPEIYASVVSSANKDLEIPAVYQLPIKPQGQPAYVFGNADASYGGCVANGYYYCHYVNWDYGFPFPAVSVYDIETGNLEADWLCYSYDILAMDLAYNPVDREIYGIFVGYDEEDESEEEFYYLGRIEYPDFDDYYGQPEIIGLLKLDGEWVSLAIDNEGTIYGVQLKRAGGSITNSFLYSINLDNDQVTKIGNMGLGPKPATDTTDKHFASSATFDLATNRCFWGVKDIEEKGTLYEINTATGRATRKTNFPGNEMAVGLFTRNYPVPDGAPAAATGLTADYANAAKNGSFKFTLPTKLFNGGNATGNIEYLVRANGEDIGEGAGAPGAEITINHEFENSGAVTFTCFVYNDAGFGPVAAFTTYVGYVEAATPQNVKLVETSNGKVVLSWDPVTTDIDGNTPPEITYAIVTVDGNYIGEILNSGNYTGTSYEYQIVPEGQEQEMVQMAVFAVCEGGMGSAALSPMIFAGEPCVKFKETFADGSISYDYLLNRNTTKGTFYLNTDASDFKDQNGDNGYLEHYGYYLDDSATLTSPKISFAGVNEPVMTLWAYTIVDPESGTVSADVLDISINEPGQEPISVFNKTMAEIGNNEEGWHKIVVDLSAYKDKTIQFNITGIVKTFRSLFIDNIYVGPNLTMDASAVKVEAPNAVKAGDDYTVTVHVSNEGFGDVPAHNVHLYVDGVKGETKEVPAIAVEGKSTIDFGLNMHVLAEEPVKLHAVIELDGDQDDSNNTTSVVSVNPVLSTLPHVTDLEATTEGKTVTLTWSEPEITAPEADAIVDFEDGNSFAQEYAGWTFVDIDASPVGGFQGSEIPGMTAGETKASFFVFEQDGITFNETFAAHSGNKYLASLFRWDDGQVDDWAISPKLNGEAQTISFWAQSYSTQYPEAIQVLYSTTDTNVASFTVVVGSTVNPVPGDWTQYNVELPAGALYFAVRSFASSSFMLMLDDFEFKADTSMPTITGFNVYRDGVKVNSDLLDEGYFADNLDADGKYTYAVTATYLEGESRGSNRVEAQVGEVGGIAAVTNGSVTIEAANGTITVTGAEGKTLTISAVDGKNVFTTDAAKATTTVAVAQGVYVVKAGDTVAKVIVK